MAQSIEVLPIQAWWPTFNPWDPHQSGRRDVNLQSCLWTFTHMLWLAHALHTHHTIHSNKHKICFQKLEIKTKKNVMGGRGIHYSNCKPTQAPALSKHPVTFISWDTRPIWMLAPVLWKDELLLKILQKPMMNSKQTKPWWQCTHSDSAHTCSISYTGPSVCIQSIESWDWNIYHVPHTCRALLWFNPLASLARSNRLSYVQI